MRITTTFLILLAAGVVLSAQKAILKIEPVERQMPAYIVERLSAADRVLFDKLMRMGLEAAWSLVTAEGYPQNFINELSPLKPNTRMVGRARTMRYLPNRKDVRDKVYAAGPQLNYKSAEEAQPGDVLVFDAGGETRAGVSGAVTTLRRARARSDADANVHAPRPRVIRGAADDERRLPGTGAHRQRDGDTR
jgi:hypothetical protein